MPAARVHAPFTLSETMTWPAASSSANSPVNRSPAATGFASVKVTLVWRVPVGLLGPWADVAGGAAVVAGSAGGCAGWFAGASNAVAAWVEVGGAARLA